MSDRDARCSRLPLLLLTALALTGCGSSSGPDMAPQLAAPSEDSFETFGDYEVHSNAVRSDLLSPEVARV